MRKCLDPVLRELMDELDAARGADIPVIPEIRECRERIIRYFAWCVREDIRRHAERANRKSPFHVITNDGPVKENPRRMSSPVKTDEVRAFEARVGHVFGINASAVTEWPTG
jgi:hypothetical protein